jgi:transcriptional regulator with PAS, ATPase and Fis domain
MYFINKYSNILTKKISSISEDALNILKVYPWPGNVRELENAIEYAVNMEDLEIIQVHNLPSRIISYTKPNTSSTLKDKIYEKEFDLIIDALDKNGWDVKGKEKAAKELGFSIRTLYRKLNDGTKAQTF